MSICTNTLLFYCAPPDDLSSIERTGLVPESGAALRLNACFEKMLKTCEGKILVVDGNAVPEWGYLTDGDTVLENALTPEAIMNLRPFRNPKPIDAAGGYVIRERSGNRELLLILRRGVWDLPKGKLDKGESFAAAALREAREELGIERLALGRSLGSTVHGYPHKGHFIVKTTHWFAMTAQEETFYPQAEEDIESAEWFPWHEASRRLGYESLRRHTRRVQQLIESA